MNGQTVEILLVEDNPNDAELALHALRKKRLGNHIQIARDGEEALDFIFCRGAYDGRAFGHFPRLILLDLKLPKVDGTEVLRQLKSDPRTRPIPVTVLTSSKEESDMARTYDLGANSYIQKPVDFERLCGTVEQLGMYWLLVNHLPGFITGETISDWKQR